MSDAQAHSEDHPVVAKERPELLLICGILGMLGGIVMTVGTFVMQAITPDHNPISDTISDLARGDLHFWMDAIFYFNAAGLVALALGTSHAHLGKWAWSLGIITLTLIALIVTMLGLYDEFGQDVEGMSTHTSLSTLLWPLFLIGPLAMASGIGRIGDAYKWMFIASGVLWAIAAPAFFFSPDNIDGIVERIAGAFTLLWTVPLGWMLFDRGRRSEGR